MQSEQLSNKMSLCQPACHLTAVTMNSSLCIFEFVPDHYKLIIDIIVIVPMDCQKTKWLY